MVATIGCGPSASSSSTTRPSSSSPTTSISKGGDQPLFGRFQPPVQSTEVQRLAQVTEVREFVGAIHAVDRDANIVDYDVVHINAEFFDQASGHDPQVVRITPGN